MKFVYTNISCLFLLFTCTIMPGQNKDLFNLVPEAPKDWRIETKPKIYGPKTLYEYINGGAELYISYGMNSVISTRFIKEGTGEIRIEIFDMHNDKNAFGVFSHTRTKNEKIYGNGSQYFTGALIFWKGKYYISIVADDDNNIIKNTISDIAKEIEQNISKNGKEPEIINLLPAEDLVPDGFICFNHYIWLNSYYFLSNENILNIDEKCSAVISKYNIEQRRQYLLLINYYDIEKANTAFSSFRSHFLDNKAGGEIIKIEDGSWITGKQVGTFLIGIFNSHSKLSAEELLLKTEMNLNY